ncbi:MAG TPA: universal stress protein [Solirubrobacteraceae bacterium]|jgi:nucleotide-binding universal stress UspA family protein|nr:universal stress protein [Solirubrobacteraceae bacterium]
MFERIVVGFDGTSGGRDAFALARGLAAPGADVVLVAVVPVDRRPTPLGEVETVEELMRADAAADVEAAAAGHDCRTRVVTDWSPARALHRVAEEDEADLIVVGSAHHGAVGRVLLGDVTRATLHDAPCPVAVAPHGFAEHATRIVTVGAGVDDSDEARAAVGTALAVARAAGGSLRLLSAVPTPAAAGAAYAYAFDWTEIQESERLAAEQELARLADDIEGLPVRTETVDGLPARALEDLSEHVDLLVVGSRGWGAVRRVLLGSTSDRLAHRAHCPLLVVPRPAGDREQARYGAPSTS